MRIRSFGRAQGRRRQGRGQGPSTPGRRATAMRSRIRIAKAGRRASGGRGAFRLHKDVPRADSRKAPAALRREGARTPGGPDSPGQLAFRVPVPKWARDPRRPRPHPSRPARVPTEARTGPPATVSAPPQRSESVTPEGGEASVRAGTATWARALGDQHYRRSRRTRRWAVRTGTFGRIGVSGFGVAR